MIESEFVGYGPVDRLLEDDAITYVHMIEDVPNPQLGTRVFRAMFGDNNVEIVLSSMLYQGFGNIVLGQYESVTAFNTDLQGIMQDMSNIRLLFDTDNPNNTQNYFAGDVFAVMGLAFCAVEDYETSLQWLNQGIEIDPTSIMSCGKPVIATRSGGPEDFVTPEVGILIPTDDVTALADAMKTIFDNYEQYDAKAIRAYCINNFSEESIVEQLDSIYRHVTHTTP